MVSIDLYEVASFTITGIIWQEIAHGHQHHTHLFKSITKLISTMYELSVSSVTHTYNKVVMMRVDS